MKKITVGQKFYARNGSKFYIKIKRIEEDGRYLCLMSNGKRSVVDVVDYKYINIAYLIK